ncbi:MAG: methionyl-tRNA formyltransferase [Burkholderiales bacterium]|nr:methionyl-tRNA formyltransferase [Burkholderiales bacterium]
MSKAAPRVAFAGTPAFAARALEAILAAGFPVPLVLTQPDRPSGRGLAVASSPVKTLAVARGLPVLQPATLRAEEARAPVLAVAADVLVVAAYGLILPSAVLAWPRHGGLNIHASLLPRWRGAAPIQHAILAGDAATGITFMQMDAGLDTGPMIERVEVAIGARETAGSLLAKLSEVGAEGIVRVLARLEMQGSLAAEPQAAHVATYAPKVERAHAALDWAKPAAALDRAVRAFDPVPGAHATFGGETVKVWSAEPLAGDAARAPGTVLAVNPGGVDVACSQGSLRLLTLQPPGGKRMSASAFAAGRGVIPGVRFT